jgi:hypothetical protein
MLVAAGATVTKESRGNWPLHACFDSWLRHPDRREPYRAVLIALLRFGAEPTKAMIDNIVHYDLDAELLRTFLGAASRLPWYKDFLDGGGTLYLSAALGDVSLKIMQVAIEAGANVNAWSALCGTPLITAVRYEHEQVVRELIRAKADIGLATHRGETPLLTATMGGSVVMVEMLLAAGADPDQRGNILLSNDFVEEVIAPGTIEYRLPPAAEWITPLILSARLGHLKVASRLIDAGADPEAQDLQSKTALDWAREMASPELINLLSTRVL